MRKKSFISYVLVLFLVASLSSCALSPSNPKKTVKQYLDEMMIVKDPLYRQASRDELKGDKAKAERYAEAGRTVNELLWTDPSSSKSDSRKKLLMALGTIVTFKGYKITSERVEGDKAYITVILEKTSLLGKDMGEASQQESKPITYELVKTRQGWRIKDVDGILTRAGM